MFFFSSNYGQIDSLVDDGSKKNRRYRLLALIAPLAVTGIYVLYYVRTGFGEDAAVRGVESAVIAVASYYHLKHLIIPDVKYGIVRSIRKYNLLALIYAFLCMAEMLLSLFPLPFICTAVLCVLFCLTLTVLIPVLEKGAKTWTI